MKISSSKDPNGWIGLVLAFLSLVGMFCLAVSLAHGHDAPSAAPAKTPIPLQSSQLSFSRMESVVQADCTDSSVASQGCWQTRPELMVTPENGDLNPIHLGMMHTGKVLVLSGSGALARDLDEHILKAAVWNPVNGIIAVQDLQYDLWCNGMAFLPDGRALIVGGTESYGPPSFEGEARASIFDPLTEQFYQVQSMQNGRWYATVTALGDGQLLTFSGLDQTGNVNSLIENYKIALGWDPQSQSPWTPPLYPWLHLLPDGRLFYSGYTNNSRFYDPVAKTWSDPPIPTIFNLDPGRVYGSSMLLPLEPPLYTPRVMNLGGANLPNGGTAPFNSPAVATTEIIDLSSPTPAWQSGPSMSVPRVHMNAVLLPTGKVLALGGSLTSQTPDSPGTGGYLTDLIDPVLGGTTTFAGVASYARLYHSMAMLLPDATVLVAGSNPVTFANRQYEKHMEIYSPAYLFTSDGIGGPSTLATRPTILNAPSIIGYGGTDFQVQVGDSDVINSVLLVRPGSPTHAFDMEQRLVKLSFSPGATGVINVTPPPATNANGANIAPPGYYMLFVLNNLGVPSVATFIQLSLNPLNPNPEGTITSPANDLPILTGQQIEFNGSANNPNLSPQLTFSWVFPDATPDGSNSPSAGPVTVSFPTPGTYVVSLTVADSTGASDPSPPTRTVTVTDPPPVTLHINTTTGTGSGSVTSNPAGIICPTDCDEDYLPSTVVTLTATADGGSVFTGWNGGWCSGTGTTCQPTHNSNTTVTAKFDIAPATVTLNITKAGSGTVKSTPAGIDCGPTCSKVYNFGDSVTLTATADVGSVFNGWSDGSCSGTSTCVLVLNSDPTAVKANFIIVPPLTLETSPLPDAEVGVSYIAPLVNGGVPLYAFTFLKGSSPQGLSPSSSTGDLSGTPTSSKSGSFTVQVTYQSGGPVTGSFNIKILKALGISTKSLKSGTHGKSYNGTLKATGGKAPYTWSLAPGSSLPLGLILSSAGAITGVVDPAAAIGPYSFTVQVTDPIKATDPVNSTVPKSFTLTIK